MDFKKVWNETAEKINKGDYKGALDQVVDAAIEKAKEPRTAKELAIEGAIGAAVVVVAGGAIIPAVAGAVVEGVVVKKLIEKGAVKASEKRAAGKKAAEEEAAETKPPVKKAPVKKAPVKKTGPNPCKGGPKPQ